jgi:hypothetical protein
MKKGQLKIQEMAFVLLALVLLSMIGLVFVLRISSQKLTESAQDIKTAQTMSMVEKVANTPEFECFCKPSCRSNCMDEDRVNSFKSIQGNQKEIIFHEISNIKIIRVYPEGADLMVYDSGKQSNASSYSTFINLCKYETIGEYQYNCDVAMIVVKGA